MLEFEVWGIWLRCRIFLACSKYGCKFMLWKGLYFISLTVNTQWYNFLLSFSLLKIKRFIGDLLKVFLIGQCSNKSPVIAYKATTISVVFVLIWVATTILWITDGLNSLMQLLKIKVINFSYCRGVVRFFSKGPISCRVQVSIQLHESLAPISC
jgi:hypothetical protein